MATPVLRSVPCANKRYSGDRKTNDRFPKTKFKISKTFLVIRVTFNLAHSHTPARPIPPPPPSNTIVPFLFGSFLNTSIIHKTTQLRPLSCQSVFFSGEDKIEDSIFILQSSNSAVVEQRDRRNGESVHFRFRA